MRIDLRHFISRINVTLPRRLYGRRFRVPLLAGTKASVSGEPWMLDLLASLLPKVKGAFLDVGVHLGETLLKVKAVDMERPYLGFEPNPVCVAYVRELIRRNQFRGCTIAPVGLFNRDGLLNLALYNNQATDSSASIIPRFRPEQAVRDTMLVPVCRAESIWNVVSPGHIGIVKIDVEGAEHEVLESLSSVFRKERPILLLELLPVYTKQNRMRLERQLRVERLLADWQYQLFRVHKKTKGQFNRLQPIDAVGIHDDLGQCDYLAAPEEVQERICDLGCARKTTIGRSNRL